MTSYRVSRVVTDAPWGSDVVASARPLIGWHTETPASAWRQARAEVECVRPGQADVVHELSGRDQVRIEWPFEPLTPRERAAVRVRVQGEDGQWSPWSEPRAIIGGFLADGEWKAASIGASAPAQRAQPVLMRQEFTIDGEIASAWLYATAVGVYQAAINGHDVDDHIMKPGWTAYQERTVHESTDVTALLIGGANAIGVRLAGAWATELYGFAGNWHPIYADQPRFAGQLVITYTDGRIETISTDAGWTWNEGPLRESSLYHGESFDARVRLTDEGGVRFDEPAFDGATWQPVAIVDAVPVPSALVAPFVRVVETREVVEVITTPSGKTVVDFGQNLVGRLRIRVRGEAGTEITLRHAEVLEHGELGVRPLREARATDTFILGGGNEEETWHPEFTFHGFRYAEIEGWPGVFDPTAVTAEVIHSDMERTGWFETSHTLVQKLHDNVVWGLRGNFLSVPTDCPQRDERLGWTGDIQVFAPTASFLYDVRGFLDSWLSDLTVDQVDGVVPFVVPNVLGDPRPAAAWGDAATVVPDVLFDRFGDLATLRRQYPSMRAWTDAIATRAGARHLWEGSFQFGDWLDPDAPPQNAAKAKTDPDLVATAYLFRSASLVARAATLLGDAAAAEQYSGLAERVRAAFLAEYMTPSGRMMSDAQTAYALAIAFDIVDDERRQAVGDRLAALTRAGGFHIGTGFVGTPIITDALTDTGHIEEARRLLFETGNPSWLYPVTMGATTIWERWDSMLPDGTINPGEMTSFNHYALGAVADWLHRRVAGLESAAPGYAHLRIAPVPLDGMSFARAEHITPFGLARAGWERRGDVVIVSAVVPANTEASVVLPDGRTFEVGSGAHEWQCGATPVLAQEPVSLNTPLDEIVRDEAAYDILIAAITTIDPQAPSVVRTHTGWGRGTSVRELLTSLVGGDLRDQVSQQFDALNDTRTGA